MHTDMKLAIIGRQKDTARYETYFSGFPLQVITTLTPGELSHCDGMVLPGGGDITPAFFGEHNKGSRNIDTELDIIQLQAIDYCIRKRVPVLGICKGMQVINVAFGGTILQDLPTAGLHRYMEGDQYHPTDIAADSFLARLYGRKMTVNSAHHQGVGKPGKGLVPIQWCPLDQCIEALIHKELPIIGVQWHPERLCRELAGTDGAPLLSYFVSLMAAY